MGVVGAEHDWHDMEIRIPRLLLSEIFAADEREDQVDFGDDDTAKSQRSQEEWG